MRIGIGVGSVIAATLICASSASAQTFSTTDPVLQRIWREGMEQSQTWKFAQALLDSVGPRLTGSPGHKAGNDWLVAVYKSLGIETRNEQYGTWKGWRRGITHIDMLTPRVRTLEGTMLAWSPGTGGKPVTAGVVILPDVKDSTEFVRWLPQVQGKYVLVSMPQPTCRADESWQQNTDSATFARMREQRATATAAWSTRLRNTGYALGLGTGSLGRRLEAAGAAGVIASRWSNGWGVNKVFNTQNTKAPALDLSCEDYGLLYRLADNGDNPSVRVNAEAEFLGEVPVFNTIATIPGTQLPNEFVLLSAHFDSWDGGSGATDNGTGTLTMLEAMRILKATYPNPKRTIIVGHWGGEEEGLIGSRSFAKDHPEIVAGLQAQFNQDNGTGRIQNLSAAGLISAGSHIAKWASQLPAELSRGMNFTFPGTASGGGSDNASFACYGAPAFGLGSIGFDYGIYTWHTQRDTFDKISFDDLRNNATLTAMLTYLASEDTEKVGRERRTVMPLNPQTRQPTAWPTCAEPARNSTNYFRQ